MKSSTIQVCWLLTAADPVAGMHGVDTAELLEIPALYSLFSGKADDLMARIRGIAKVRDLYGQIHGGLVSDEQLSQPNGAVVWTEMCDQATWSASQQTLLAITGHVQYADAVERIVFNGKRNRPPSPGRDREGSSGQLLLQGHAPQNARRLLSLGVFSH
jgi:hypothetical protein